MSAQIILFGGEKGGTGKSTLAQAMAVMLASSGSKTLLVDMDPQETTMRWAARRASRHMVPAVVQVQDEEPGERLFDLAESYDHLVLDIGGRDNPAMRQALVASDILVTPANATQNDIDGLASMSRIVGEVKMVNRKLRALAVAAQVSTNPALTYRIDAMRKAVAVQAKKLRMLDVIIHDRLAYSRPGALGLCAFDDEDLDRKAVAELHSLYAEVIGEPLTTKETTA